jgi:hypothetical protein
MTDSTNNIVTQINPSSTKSNSKETHGQSDPINININTSLNKTNSFMNLSTGTNNISTNITSININDTNCSNHPIIIINPVQEAIGKTIFDVNNHNNVLVTTNSDANTNNVIFIIIIYYLFILIDIHIIYIIDFK